MGRGGQADNYLYLVNNEVCLFADLSDGLSQGLIFYVLELYSQEDILDQGIKPDEWWVGGERGSSR